MSVDPATAGHRFEHDGTTYYFCCAGCRTKFAADPARYLRAEARAAAIAIALQRPPGRSTPARWTRRCARRARDLPDLRHGARARAALRGGTAQRRTDRHEAPALVCARADDPARRPRHGRTRLSPRMAHAAALELDRVRARDARRARRRLAVLRAGLGVAPHPQPQHVHPDRDRRRRRLDLQPRRDACARALPPRVRPRTGRRSISRRRP